MGAEILAAIMFGCFILGGILYVTGKMLLKYVERKEREKKHA
jgi:hypothetical protein